MFKSGRPVKIYTRCWSGAGVALNSANNTSGLHLPCWRPVKTSTTRNTFKEVWLCTQCRATAGHAFSFFFLYFFSRSHKESGPNPPPDEISFVFLQCASFWDVPRGSSYISVSKAGQKCFVQFLWEFLIDDRRRIIPCLWSSGNFFLKWQSMKAHEWTTDCRMAIGMCWHGVFTCWGCIANAITQGITCYLRQDPTLIRVAGHFLLFCTMV